VVAVRRAADRCAVTAVTPAQFVDGRGVAVGLRVVPVRFRHAREFVAAWHRHSSAPQGALFCVGVADILGVLRGVAIVGRPVARMLDNYQTAEVIRCCTDGVPNGCSMLYGAAWRACKAMGYTKLITYTRRSEGGESLRAVGWRTVAERPKHGGWSRSSRRRLLNGAEDDELLRWEAA
jgi:hypothetical protein